jgi:MFS family permease
MSTINYSEQFDIKSPNTFRAWLVVLTSALFFFYIFIQMNLFNSINSELVKEFNFNAKQLGHLFAFFSYGNIVFLFPAGILLDRLSVRKILFVVFIISVFATHIFSTTSTFWVMCMARLVIGVAGAFALLSAVKLASRWFQPKHLALVIGMIVTVGMFGGAAAQTPLTLLTHNFGWRFAMQLVVTLGLAIIILQLLIVRDEPKKLVKPDAKEHVELKKFGFWHSLGITVNNPQNWLSGIYICLVNLPLFIFGGIWGVPYLTHVHRLTKIQATAVTSMIFIGMIIGSPLAGLISDRMGLRKPPMIAGAILSILVMLIIMFAPTLPFAIEISLYFALGLIISCQVIGYPVISESNPHAITATATSLGSVLIMSGGMLVTVFGWLLEMSGGAKIVDNAAVYSLADFTRANYLMLIGLVIALVASLLIKETYCKQLHQRNLD